MPRAFARVGGRVGSATARRNSSPANGPRGAKLGLWAISYYDLLNADDPADVLAERGRFALVEGKVVSVRESGATIYVNFGRRWTEDFTVTILKRNERSLRQPGLEPKTARGPARPGARMDRGARRALDRGDAAGTD